VRLQGPGRPLSSCSRSCGINRYRHRHHRAISRCCWLYFRVTATGLYVLTASCCSSRALMTMLPLLMLLLLMLLMLMLLLGSEATRKIAMRLICPLKWPLQLLIGAQTVRNRTHSFNTQYQRYYGGSVHLLRPGRRINHVVSSYRLQKQQPNFGACLHGVQLLPLSSCCRCANQHRSAVWLHIHLFSRGACKRVCCSSVATHLTCAPLISHAPFFVLLLTSVLCTSRGCPLLRRLQVCRRHRQNLPSLICQILQRSKLFVWTALPL
jgi:hypothetical protein